MALGYISPSGTNFTMGAIRQFPIRLAHPEIKLDNVCLEVEQDEGPPEAFFHLQAAQGPFCSRPPVPTIIRPFVWPPKNSLWCLEFLTRSFPQSRVLLMLIFFLENFFLLRLPSCLSAPYGVQPQESVWAFWDHNKLIIKS